jgi:hypothetical protein
MCDQTELRPFELTEEVIIWVYRVTAASREKSCRV